MVYVREADELRVGREFFDHASYVAVRVAATDLIGIDHDDRECQSAEAGDRAGGDVRRATVVVRERLGAEPGRQAGADGEHHDRGDGL